MRPDLLTRWLPVLFAALAGPLCIVLALAVPTGEAPDEPAHAVRTESLLHGEVLGHRDGTRTIEAGVTANPALLEAASSFSRQPLPLSAKRLTPERRAALQQLRWDAAARFVPAPNTAVYFPAFYVPAAVALAGARWAGAGPYDAMLVARLGNAAAFVVLGALALAVARAGQILCFVTLSLPMTLSLAASVSPDGPLIATAALAAASLTRTSAGRWRWLAGTGIALLGATKPAYLPLGLAMLAGRVGRPAWRDAGVVVAVALPGLAWAVFALTTVATPFGRPAYPAGPLWPGPPRMFDATDVAAQAWVLAARPWRLATLPLALLREQPRNLLLGAIGVLGRLDLPLPRWLYHAWTAGLAAAAAADLLGRRPAGWRSAAVPLGLGVLLGLEAICLLQYLSWTPVGAAAIEGVQGRYVLPLLPFVGIALASLRLSDRPALRLAVSLPAVACAAVDVVAVSRLVLASYG